ncbi:ATP-dependent Clp protease, proteolytic subunit ClpP [Borreliella afzelii ACA-1]|uniref:ATP-dependent Clp protease proteolytic subunit n=2 Tax=Borreliella afzelii TaxID=29518 RepID=CLPP_BORAP|nr:RecName: Full=ATP-dependent Clp protease proteolytic subunit; AltName: Full=Endopeptidase Clp [Borreliella afzelii PKo]ABH01882.1 ATP-dependent Clp protease proteolytic component [Borreliella afzelii PKo]AFU74909.1 ATP-dependent Clp protease proteolytic component [Borreliella afzelii HLJ01]APJ08521.1 ATP-dependent Clp endopeptidase, proteolytic subunit ClpP [Borreliella afzelii]EEC21191.1 ATP-dependent Clp protease, proteolytic subunit ClpP [Borreliella afzelii ACA-1]
MEFMHNLIPTVIEHTGNYERVFDIYSRLLRERIIFLSGEINDPKADTVIAQLLFLESEDSNKDIYLYLNSPGGSITAGLAIYDTMQYIKPDVRTICIGQAASMGAFLLAAGAKGKRESLTYSRIMIHQPWGGISGQASDINIQANEILRLKKLIIDIMSNQIGVDKEKLALDMERDYFMTSSDALKYGLIDNILVRE